MARLRAAMARTLFWRGTLCSAATVGAAFVIAGIFDMTRTPGLVYALQYPLYWLLLFLFEFFAVFGLAVIPSMGVGWALARYVRRHDVLPHWMIGVAACLLLASFVVPLGFGAEALALPLVIHCLAHARVPLWRATRRIGDISYGLYVYAFPVQQAVWASCAAFLGFWAMAAVSAAIATGLALLSWHVVEKPALAWKQRIAARAGANRPAAQARPSAAPVNTATQSAS